MRFDFLSSHARGRPLRPPITPRRERLWRGLSVYDSPAAAVAKARRSPQLGQFVVELDLAADPSITIEKTMDDAAHYTIWGEPERVMAVIRRKLPLGDW